MRPTLARPLLLALVAVFAACSNESEVDTGIDATLDEPNTGSNESVPPLDSAGRAIQPGTQGGSGAPAPMSAPTSQTP